MKNNIEDKEITLIKETTASTIYKKNPRGYGRYTPNVA
jgi:hypothetical protein